MFCKILLNYENFLSFNIFGYVKSRVLSNVFYLYFYCFYNGNPVGSVKFYSMPVTCEFYNRIDIPFIRIFLAKNSERAKEFLL